MDLLVIGMGRAGGSLARAATAAGHRLVGVLNRSPVDDYDLLDWNGPFPSADLALITVTDAAIPEVASRLADYWAPATPVVHVSGFTPVAALEALAAAGAATGSFHPLQTLPDPERGAEALAGAHAAITATGPLQDLLEQFALSLGMHPFFLADEAKPLYHAAAAAASNYVVEALGVAADLLAAAGVDPGVMQPLTRQVVENVFAVGADAALTGPIARGDIGTVAGQVEAADSVGVGVGRQFRLLAAATALRAGTDIADVLR